MRPTMAHGVIIFVIYSVLMFKSCTCSYVRSYSKPIHELMNDEERVFYFGDSYSEDSVPDYQIVLLGRPLVVLADSEDGRNEEEELLYDFNALGRKISLRLKPNRHLISPHFKIIKTREDGSERFDIDKEMQNCHYLHRDGESSAAISLCQDKLVNGFVLLANETLEIHPLSPRLHSYITPPISEGEDFGPGDLTPHVIRLAPLNIKEGALIGDTVEIGNDALEGDYDKLKYMAFKNKRLKKRIERATNKLERLTMETAVFFDEAGYKLFSPFFGRDDKQLADMLLAYMNGIQAIYHHPSLGPKKVDIVLVQMELMSRQPSAIPLDGERGKLLDSFCAYSAKKNPKGDSNPNHWDISLYVSGLDFYAIEGRRKSGVTMGLATVGGICSEKYNCVIGELGTTNSFGKPYPSAGFTAVYIMAHEIGHNLGMHHDSTQNNCPKDGYVMSPSRGTLGETQWSSCSADVMSKISWATCLNDVPSKSPSPELDHQGRYNDNPGIRWGAKRQCEFLLRDKDATVQSGGDSQEICQNLRCKTPHRSGFYFAGPALEGTTCANGKSCQGGDCLKNKVSNKPIKEIKGGWSDWKSLGCSSGCIDKSKGFQERHRTCDNPKPVNTDEGCEGPSFDVALCNDDKLCKKNNRMSIVEHASRKCGKFSSLLNTLDPEGKGLQAPHEEGRMWMACAIFCRRKDTGSYYTPRLDLNDLGVDPYFPDGTWCHNDGKSDYFCINHHCLPENFRLGKSLTFASMKGAKEDEDLLLPAQNAAGNANSTNETDMLQKYLSLGSDGKPLLTALKPGNEKHPSGEWVDDKDYREIPKESVDYFYSD